MEVEQPLVACCSWAGVGYVTQRHHLKVWVTPSNKAPQLLNSRLHDLPLRSAAASSASSRWQWRRVTITPLPFCWSGLFVEAAPDVITERVFGFLSPLFNQPSGRTMTTGNPPSPACCSRSPSLKSEYSHGYASRAQFYVSWVCVFFIYFFICHYMLIEIGSAFPVTNERRLNALSPFPRQSANCLRWATVSTVPAGIIVAKRLGTRWTWGINIHHQYPSNVIINVIRRGLLWFVAAVVYTRMLQITRKITHNKTQQSNQSKSALLSLLLHVLYLKYSGWNLSLSPSSRCSKLKHTQCKRSTSKYRIARIEIEGIQYAI